MIDNSPDLKSVFMNKCLISMLARERTSKLKMTLKNKDIVVGRPE